MRKIFWIVCLVFLYGCATARIPQYLADRNSYKKHFYASFDDALQASRTALHDLGWEITSEGDPAVYEEGDPREARQIILFTEVRQTAMFLGSRYARINIILRTKSEGTEIEIRYLTINSIPFKNIESFRNESAVQRVFERIDELLKSQTVSPLGLTRLSFPNAFVGNPLGFSSTRGMDSRLSAIG